MSLFACKGCLLVRKSFFHNNPSNSVDLGAVALGYTWFHCSFRAATALSLNIGHFLDFGDVFIRDQPKDCFPSALKKLEIYD